MEVQICVGSSCHIGGSAPVISILKDCISEYGLTKDVVLKASFCMGECLHGVCVTVDGEKIRDVRPENARAIFEEKILRRIR